MSDPARFDPARSDPARSDPARSDPSWSDRRRRRSGAGRTIVAVGTVVVALVAVTGVFLGVRAAWRSLTTTTADACTFGAFSTSTAQASVAATMVGVVTRRAMPERAAVLVLAAALQESKLRDIPAGQGDRDSVGVLQQRPSQGWGSAAHLADVSFATTAFLNKMVKVASWSTRDLATVVQAVQISADGSAYAQHEPEAQAIADALTGQTPRGISCAFPKPTAPASASALATRLRRELPVNTPTVRGATITAGGAGWVTAAWLVANAERGGLGSVSYNGWRWTRAHGWKAASGIRATAVTATTGS